MHLTQSQQALEAKFTQTLQQHLAAQGERLERCTLRLELLAPQRVLERGYAILHNAQGHALTSVQHIRQGEALQAQLADGRLEAQVQAAENTISVIEKSLATAEAQIEQAKEEWRTGKFDIVPGDETEFVPLPA